MRYVSTRDSAVQVGAARAIAQGISAEGGLFAPESLPKLDKARLERLAGMSYIDRACDILGDFLDDFSSEELRECVEGAYGGGKFASEKVAPVVKIGDADYMLELWHGPTCAFKDMALQLLPHLLTRSAAKAVGGKEIAILVATSGDTGKAALEGFRDVAGARILVFYPRDGVSEIQRLQMATQEGANVGVCGVVGNFDDTQTAVKRIFTDPKLAAALDKKNMMFSSANSINWGRLAPQIVYYVSAYCDMVGMGELKMGDTVNIAVPTGNFGNILAGYYAREMGLPIGRLICASNRNNVLTDFISTGVYDRRREFFATESPSMDILISSNLERLLFALCGSDSAVADMMISLARDGVYSVPDNVGARVRELFFGGFCGEEQTLDTVRAVWAERGYLCDTHTAVGLAVLEQYRRATGDGTKTIIASTASPYKFAGSILRALRGECCAADELAQAGLLSAMTHTKIPEQILALKNKPERFTGFCERDGMADYVRGQLGL